MALGISGSGNNAVPDQLVKKGYGPPLPKPSPDMKPPKVIRNPPGR